MKLGTEHREQVYFLVGLAVVAGYIVYLNLLSRRAEAPPAPVPAPGAPGGRRVRHSTGEIETPERSADAAVRSRHASRPVVAIFRKESGSRKTRADWGVRLKKLGSSV